MAQKKPTPFFIKDIMGWEQRKGKKIYLKKKTTRTTFTKKQKEKLNATFAVKKYLTKNEREELARELGITTEQTKIWYQNRRTRWKKDENVPNELCERLLRERGERENHQPRRTSIYGTPFRRILTAQGVIFERIDDNEGGPPPQS